MIKFHHFWNRTRTTKQSYRILWFKNMGKLPKRTTRRLPWTVNYYLLVSGHQKGKDKVTGVRTRPMKISFVSSDEDNDQDSEDSDTDDFTIPTFIKNYIWRVWGSNPYPCNNPWNDTFNKKAMMKFVKWGQLFILHLYRNFLTNRWFLLSWKNYI